MKASKDVMRTAKALFRGSFQNGRLSDDLVRAVIKRLKERRPRNFVQIAKVFQNLVRLEVANRQAHVQSAESLGGSMQEKITADLKRKYGDDLTADFSSNPELLGGIRVKVGSDVWDGSVRGRLDRLRDALGN